MANNVGVRGKIVLAVSIKMEFALVSQPRSRSVASKQSGPKCFFAPGPTLDSTILHHEPTMKRCFSGIRHMS